MRKSWSFILLLVFVLPILLLAGCDEDKVETREFNLFVSKFNEIATNIEGITATDIATEVGSDSTINKISFEYGTYLSSLVNTNDKYKFLNVLYGKMLDNALEFLYYFGYVTVGSTVQVDVQKNTALYSEYDNFVVSLNDVANALTQLERSIVMTKQGDTINANASVCLEKLKNAYTAYESAISIACNLSYMLSDIYFEDFLQNQELTFINREFVGDTSTASINRLLGANWIRARAIYYKLYYTDIFFVTNISNSDVPTKIVAGEFLNSSSLNTLSAYSSWNTLTNYNLSTSAVFSSDLSVDANATSLKNGIINFLSNENQFEEQFVIFKNNIAQVDYYKVKYDASYDATTTELAYMNLVDIFLNQYYQNNYYLLNYLLEIIY